MASDLGRLLFFGFMFNMVISAMVLGHELAYERYDYGGTDIGENSNFIYEKIISSKSYKDSTEQIMPDSIICDTNNPNCENSWKSSAYQSNTGFTPVEASFNYGKILTFLGKVLLGGVMAPILVIFYTSALGLNIIFISILGILSSIAYFIVGWQMLRAILKI